MVPRCPRKSDPHLLSNPSSRIAAKQKGTRGHLSLCLRHLHRKRLHRTHPNSPKQLRPLENPSLCPNPMFPDDIRHNIRHRKHLRHEPQLHGSGLAGRNDLYRLPPHNHVLERDNDEASPRQPRPDDGPIYSG